MSGTRRQIRLEQEYQQLQALHQRNSLICILAAEGNPPEHYIVSFRCLGIANIDGQGSPKTTEDHRVELILTIDYPRVRPLVRWKTPIFHPNFNDAGNVCIKEWYPQQTLVDLCEVLGEMVQYKNYNTTSPLNIDAAMWAMKHRNELPIDERNLLEPLSGNALPIATTVYQSDVVTRGRLSILPTPEIAASISGNEMGSLALFCGDCGFQFKNDEMNFCPNCGAKRRILI